MQSVKIVAVALYLSLVAHADAPRVALDGNRIKDYVKELCSDQFAGRLSGLPGNLQASRWISSKFKEWGLEPAGDDGSYFQELTIAVSATMPPTGVQIHLPSGPVKLKYRKQFNTVRGSASGQVKAEVVFVGYGISDKAQSWDEFAGIDLKGKIALILRGAPNDEDSKWGDGAIVRTKVHLAEEKGAAAVILAERTASRYVNPATLGRDTSPPKIPCLVISRAACLDLMKAAGKSLDDIQAKLDKTEAPQSVALGIQATAEVTSVNDNEARTRNVMGLLRGSDPVMKDEYIIISGHMDHMGPTASGEVRYGADDDASGTACMMALAEAFSKAKTRPKRSLIFVGWTGEEEGLVGSRYFVENPTVPREKIKLMIQMDMVGCGEQRVEAYGALEFPAAWKFAEDAGYSSPEKVLKLYSEGSSDNASFASKGIPAFFFMSAGIHPDYHQVTDTPDKIQPDVLQFVGQYVAEIVRLYSDLPGIPAEQKRQSRRG